jgi:molybdate transport system ATP-binding protein
MIQLDNVTVSVGEHVVVKQLNGCLQTGVGYLVKGKNGVGKTTFLQLLAGKIQPRAGSVTYDFIPGLLNWDEKYTLRRKHIHFIPAQALHELIPRQELFYQQRYYTIEESPSPISVRGYLGERLANLGQLQLPVSFELHHLLDLDLTRLSNGQMKKIIILKHLLDTIPKILLLDYPFEGLDSQSRQELSQFLDHLAAAHHIQLIIADHEHSQLPRAITQNVVVAKTGMEINERVTSHMPTAILYENHKLLRKEATPVVDMRDVTIQYGGRMIINKLNWTIQSGERWALTGRNGSGKTTLFSMIYADHPMAYSQHVSLFGKRRGSGESIWDIKKRISYLGPEQLHFLDYATARLTVREYLPKVKAASEKSEQLITRFEVDPFLSKQLQQLSHGQLQLVLLLNLFLAPKELLLLDEPFQFLDPEQKANVASYLHSFLDISTTLVLITHYEEDVSQWTHQRLVL